MSKTPERTTPPAYSQNDLNYIEERYIFLEFSVTDTNDVVKEVTVRATAPELQPMFEEAYKTKQGEIEIKGFRKGHAPLGMVKKLYGESIEYDSLSEIANDYFKKFIEERSINPLGEPTLLDMNYKRGEELTFKVKYEIKPVVTLKEYKGLNLTKVIHKVTDEEIEEEIQTLRKRNSALSPADNVTDDAFIVTVDVQELDESGTPIIGKRNQGMKIDLSDANIFPEVKSAMQGVAVHDVRRTSFETRHDDHIHKHNLELTVKSVEKNVLPELTDEFVKKITKDKVGTVEEFRKKMRTDLEEDWENMSDRRLTDELMDEIIRRHEITVPEALIKNVTTSQIESLANQYPNKKLPPEFDEEKYRTEYRPDAVWQVKWFLIREQIINAENITAQDADLEERAALDSMKMGIDKERLIAFYKTSDQVKDSIVSSKLTTFLKSQSIITETEDIEIEEQKEKLIKS
ncbi:MAG: trigger factor [Bacteroidota bacterium]